MKRSKQRLHINDRLQKKKKISFKNVNGLTLDRVFLSAIILARLDLKMLFFPHPQTTREFKTIIRSYSHLDPEFNMRRR